MFLTDAGLHCAARFCMETINQFQDRLGAQDGAIMRVDEVREPRRRRHPGPMIFMIS